MARNTRYQQQRRQPAKSSKTPWIVAAFCLGFFCVGLVGVLVGTSIARTDSPDTTQLGTDLANASQEDTEPASQTSDVQDTTLLLELNNYNFKVSGIVADEVSHQQLEQATTLVYGDLGEFDVTVDPTAPDVTTVQGLVLLPQNLNRLINGSFSIKGDALTIAGTAPDQTTKEGLATLVGGLGFTVDDQTTVADLQAPDIRFVRNGEKVSIVGDINNEQVGVILTQVIGKDFGPDNVDTSQLTIDPAVYSRFNVITVAGALKLYGAFGDFDVGFKENRFDGVLPQGVTFETGSAQLSETERAKVAVFPPLIVNLPDLRLTITGHADNVGSPEANQALSEQRAEAIIAIFEAEGVDGSRLTAIGKGSSEPIAPNETAEGRSANRRVTFTLS